MGQGLLRTQSGEGWDVVKKKRSCACGCKKLLPEGAPARRKYAAPACKIRAFRREHSRIREGGKEVYAGTARVRLEALIVKLTARIARLTSVLTAAGLPVPEEEEDL